jgi:large subunit ribosomal protein L25
MEAIELNAKQRTIVGKRVDQLRRNGLIPAVMYGAGVDSVSLELEEHETSQALIDVGGSTLIDLKVGNETHKVLLREIQRHVIRRNILHIDFLKVAMDVAIRAVVPVELIGTAPAVRELGGVLVAGLDEIEVEALPGDLPERINVDLSVLVDFDSSITVGDLALGDGVTLITEPDEAIANVVYQSMEEIVEEEEEVEVLEELEEPELVERERGEREEEEQEPEE